MRKAFGGLVAVVAGLTVGCGDRTAKEVAAMNKSNIVRLANMYSAHQNYKSRGPASETEFREFIAAFDPEKLKMMGIKSEDLDGLFTSERDGQRFRIRYGVGGGRGSVDPVIFEAAGSGGKKQVAYTGGKIEEPDDGTYESLWSAKPAPRSDPKANGRSAGAPAGAPRGPQ